LEPFVTTPPPDDLAFFAFFEVEPILLDPSVPWVYNTATYETVRDGCLVHFRIQPSYSTLRVTLIIEDREISEAEVAEFKDLEIVADNGRETLIARFGDCAASALYLTLKPKVRLSVVVGSDS